MKSFIALILLFSVTISINAQSSYFNETYRFNKFMDRINSPKGPLTYADIGGNAYYNDKFVSAKIENATRLIPVRYNKYTDAIEILTDGNVFELPKSDKYSRITFQNSPEAIVYLDSSPEINGYFFELATGKYRLLKKLKSEFRPEVKALNSFTSAVPPTFENVNPVYYFQIENQFTKISKNAKDFVSQLTEKQDEVANFIKTNKLKLNQEPDLVRLAKFLNQ